MKGFVVGLAVAKAAHELALIIARGETDFAAEVRRRAFGKAETRMLIHTRDEINKELEERANLAKDYTKKKGETK